MNTYWNGQVICPYFLREGGSRLTCEWKGREEITQKFTSKKELEEYLITYCSKEKYHQCSLCLINHHFYQQKEEKEEEIRIKNRLEELKRSRENREQ